MTIEEFRQHKYYPQQWAKELATNGILNLVLRVMDDNSPDKFVLGRDGNDDISPTRAAIELGVTRGYAKYSARLKVLGQRIAPVRDLPEPTYANPIPNPKEEPQHA